MPKHKPHDRLDTTQTSPSYCQNGPKHTQLFRAIQDGIYYPETSESAPPPPPDQSVMSAGISSHVASTYHVQGKKVALPLVP